MVFSRGIFFLYLAVLFFTLPFYALPQNDNPYGEIPYVKNYGVTDYNAQSQNWGAVQGDDLMLYFANDMCVLEYDGKNWNKIFLPNKAKPRSLLNFKGKIYVGAESEFGYLGRDQKGKTVYHSLSDTISEDIGDVWFAESFNGYVYFFAENALYTLNDEQLKRIPYPVNNYPRNVAGFNKGFILTFVRFDEEKRNNHYFFDGKSFVQKSLNYRNKKLSPIKIYLHNADTYLVFTYEGMVYSMKRKGDFSLQPLSTAEAFKLPKGVMSSVSKSLNIYCITTSKEGVYLFDENGNFLRKIDTDNGLENLEIRDCLFDKDNNLWLSNDYGISKVDLSSPITFFDKSKGVVAASEDIEVTDHNNVIGSRSGIFQLDTIDGVTRYENTGIFDYECFSLVHTEGSKYVVVGNDGLFEIDVETKTQKNIVYLYAWQLIKSKVHKDVIYVALENDGIGILKKIEGEWVYTGKVKNSNGNVRSMMEYKGKLYYSVTSKGVAVLDSTKAFEENLLEGIDTTLSSSDFSLEIFKDTLMVGSANGLMYLDPSSGKLVPFTELDGAFNKEKLLVHRLFNDKDQKLWMVLFYDSETDLEEEKIGYLTRSKGKWKWVHHKFQFVSTDIVNSFDSDINGNIWMAGGAGVYIYNDKNNLELNEGYPIYINKITLSDSIYHNYILKDTNMNLSYSFDNNFIRFEVATPSYSGISGNEYRFKLIGLTDSWSDWSKNNWVEFTKIPEGDYIFQAQAKNEYGLTSRIISFEFNVKPPWYRSWLAYVGYFLASILLMVVIIRLSIRRIKNQNIKLEALVQERTAEIASKNDELEIQKAEIEEKNNDIMSSIKYAERLQKAILPSKEKISVRFPQHFVLFKPKDIVSGDFYWLQNTDRFTFFSAVDCTGHGVPGSIVSIVGNNGLNRCINEFNLKSPGEILDQLSEIVTESFNAKSADVKDGMDMALCVYDKDAGTIHYAGANNPLVLITKGTELPQGEYNRDKVSTIYDKENDLLLIEFKADKQPIGSFDNRKPFETHSIKVKEGDALYMFSDGYVDQFGGEDAGTRKVGGKKFKSKPFKKLLLSIQNQEMEQQRFVLKQTIEKWRGTLEQIDDICVFGVKIHHS